MEKFQEKVYEAKKKISTRISKEKFYQQHTVWQKFIKSEQHMTLVFCYCGLFLLYGMADQLLGPTLIELSCLVSKPLKMMSWLFFSQNLGLLIGTLTGGVFVSRVEKNLTITLCLTANALCIATLPILHNFSWMILFVLLYGIFLGTPNTLANVMLIKVFGKQVAPYLQGVHFFYGFGAFLSPLVARPFLRESCSYDINVTNFYNENEKLANMTYDNSTGYWTKSKIYHKNDDKSDVMYAYWMVALLHVPVIFSLLWLYFKRYLDHQKGIYRDSLSSLHEDDEMPVQSLDMIPYNPEQSFWERIRKDTRQRLLAVTVICSLLMYLFEGLMAMYGGYAYSFAVKGVANMTSDQGAYLTSMYWGFFSFGRFCCIVLAFFVTPKSMLMANVGGCFVSAIVLVAGHQNMQLVFIGTSMLGLSLSSTAPTVISMAELYVDLTAKSTSMLVISSALGELTMPLIVGQAFERVGPAVVPGTVFIICFAGVFVFCVLLTFDNDKAYEHASALWKIAKNIICFGCESDQQKKYREHQQLKESLLQSSTRPENTESEPLIPQPTIVTKLLQPTELDFIDEDEIIGDVFYGISKIEIKHKNLNDESFEEEKK